MKIKKDDYVEIVTSLYQSLEFPLKKIDYNKWVKFIESHKNYFTWYEDTPDGIATRNNIDKVPEDFKDRVLQSLNKVSAYSIDKIVKKTYELIITYRMERGTISVSIENDMTTSIAKILLEMAKFLDGQIIINGSIILENIKQLDNEKSMTRDELIKLGKKILKCKDREKLQKMVELFNENVPHPDGVKLFYYPENYDEREGYILNYNPSVEEVIDIALSYKQ